MLGEDSRGSGGPLKEVVVGVEVVSLAVIGRRFGVSVLPHPAKSLLAQTHDPGQQEQVGCVARSEGESRSELLDDGTERVYHAPHGGTSASWVCPLQEYEEPPLSSPSRTTLGDFSDPSIYWALVQIDLRKFSSRTGS